MTTIAGRDARGGDTRPDKPNFFARLIGRLFRRKRYVG